MNLGYMIVSSKKVRSNLVKGRTLLFSKFVASLSVYSQIESLKIPSVHLHQCESKSFVQVWVVLQSTKKESLLQLSLPGGAQVFSEYWELRSE